MLKWLTALVLSFLSLLSPSGNQPQPTPLPAKFAFPISNYSQRITAKNFGQYVTAVDARKFPCGAAFTGYHTGVDLETTQSEQDQAIPVYSIADGQIAFVGHIIGYGGMMAIKYPEFTAYYGHISLASTKLRAGESVAKGQELAMLGQGCSAETDNERKHLHFAVHKGTDIDYRGYVTDTDELAAWLDPNVELKAN